MDGKHNRKVLQALCKERGIPANKTNAYMAEALGALLTVRNTLWSLLWILLPSTKLSLSSLTFTVPFVLRRHPKKLSRELILSQIRERQASVRRLSLNQSLSLMLKSWPLGRLFSKLPPAVSIGLGGSLGSHASHAHMRRIPPISCRTCFRLPLPEEPLEEGTFKMEQHAFHYKSFVMVWEI